MSESNVAKIPGSIAKLNEEARAGNEFMDNVRVLVDHSGSMAGAFSGGSIKSSAAQKAMDCLYDSTDWGICDMKVFAFDDYPQEVPCSDCFKPLIPGPDGGTNFAAALRIALEDVETNRIILCSDGEAQYPADEVERCIERAIPVDTIYIKDAGGFSHGEELLQRISEETGGTFCTAESAEVLMQAFRQLETSQRLLLSHQPGENDVIKL